MPLDGARGQTLGYTSRGIHVTQGTFSSVQDFNCDDYESLNFSTSQATFIIIIYIYQAVQRLLK